MTQGRLIVDIARLAPEGEWYEGELAPELLDLGASELITPRGGIRYRLKVELIGRELLVRGRLSHDFVCTCRRCVAEFELEVVEPGFLCSFEIDLQSEYMDLTAEAREAIILALPSYPICRQNCNGLCMKCGIDLNKAQCQCARSVPDERWAALGQIELSD